MPLDAFVAFTEQLPAFVAVSRWTLIAQPLPVTKKLSSPDPEPPEAVNASGVPTVPFLTLLDTLRAACVARAKVNVTGAETAGPYEPLAALVAVTTHWARPVALSDVPNSVQFAPVTEKLSTPEPVPPVAVNFTAVPAVPFLTLLDTFRAACVARAKVNVTGAD
jgi:hypothetical protein